MEGSYLLPPDPIHVLLATCIYSMFPTFPELFADHILDLDTSAQCPEAPYPACSTLYTCPRISPLQAGTPGTAACMSGPTCALLARPPAGPPIACCWAESCRCYTSARVSSAPPAVQRRSTMHWHTRKVMGVGAELNLDCKTHTASLEFVAVLFGL